MRLVPQHGVAGYITPQQRPSCRNCRHLASGEENGLGQVLYRSCNVHKFEVRTGGFCNSYVVDKYASPKRGNA